MTDGTVLRRLDAVVDAFCRRVRYFQEPMTPGRARSFVRQHRLNTRQRNSVLKLCRHQLHGLGDPARHHPRLRRGGDR